MIEQNKRMWIHFHRIQIFDHPLLIFKSSDLGKPWENQYTLHPQFCRRKTCRVSHSSTRPAADIIMIMTFLTLFCFNFNYDLNDNNLLSQCYKFSKYNMEYLYITYILCTYTLSTVTISRYINLKGLSR